MVGNKLSQQWKQLHQRQQRKDIEALGLTDESFFAGPLSLANNGWKLDKKYTEVFANNW